MFTEEPVILATQAHQVFYLDDPKMKSLSAIEWMSTSRMTICVGLTLIPQLLKDLLCIMSPTMTLSTMWMNTCHMQAEQATTTNDSDEPCTMSSFSCSFDETDAMLLEFVDDLDNFAGGSSSVRDNSSTSQPFATLTTRRCMFVEHQMLSTFKEFWGDYHRHFKKYNDPEEACVNPPHLLVGRNENLHYLCDYYMSRAFQAKLDQVMQRIEEQTRNHEALVSEVEQMRKLIEDMTRAQQGLPHDP
ncbi:gamma-aminobutyrate transaminase POP2 [Cucumis melo var. makuwa]|uniref:Gamma-aminobutyrate transaminase POP2 n=1 Tax=Cucumis melo var. makuwa TaxID=1194695 RepID=A0A5D3BW56_CUCMM|nr:gamma-aminobutyrate transaminase POP2 [Cucumis melo var. makuwa]